MVQVRPKIKYFLKTLPVFYIFLFLVIKIWKLKGYLCVTILDIIETWRSTKFLRNITINPCKRTLNLFVLDDDSIYTIKLMAFMCQGLRLEGWKIQAVMRNRSKFLGKIYLRTFGINHFIYLEDYRLTFNERQYCQHRVQAFMAESLNFQNVKSWVFEECWIGPQLIATLSRSQIEGRIDFTQNQVQQRLKELLTDTLEYVLQAHKLCKLYPANLAMTIEANYALYGSLVDATIAYGCNVIQCTQPWRDDALIFRRLTQATRRNHPSSVSEKTLNRLVKQPWTKQQQQILERMFEDRYNGRWFLQKRNQPNTRSYTKTELVTHFELDASKPIVTVFSQVLWDANLFYGDDLFEDAGEWFVETIRAACTNTKMNWLIKVHPANIWKRNYENVTQEYAENVLIKKYIGVLPPHVKLIAATDNVSTFSLFQLIDYGVTVRGTSGMELACFGKTCVTAGTGRYSGLGFTLDSDNREQYLKRLAELHLQTPMREMAIKRAKWHAYAAFMLRPWSMLSAKANFLYSDRGSTPLDHNLFLKVNSIEELTKNGDINGFSQWAKGDEVDYLDLDELEFNV